MSNGTAVVEDRNLETVEVSKVTLQELVDATQNKARELQGLVIVPKSFEETEKYAKYIRQSQTCPRTKEGPWSEADIFIAIQTGLELGISPMMALSGIAIINGRPTIWGDLALALVLRSGLVEEWYERPAKEALAKGEGYFRIKRKGNPNPIEVYFSVEDAKRANLWGKQGPWTNYTGRMLQMRPRSWGLRDGFADVLKGIGISEEIRDIPVATPHTDAALQETELRKPLSKSEAAKAAAETKPAAPPKETPAPVESSKPAPAPAPENPAPAGNGAATEGTGEYLITKVERVDYDEKKDGKPTGKKKHFYKLYTGDEKTSFATFSDTEASTANDSIGKGPVAIAWKKTNGKENLAIKSLAPVLAESQIPEDREPGQEG